MTTPIYDITLAAIPGDNDHHPRCAWADEDRGTTCPWPEDCSPDCSTEGCSVPLGRVPDCTCDDLRAEDDEDAAYRRYEETRK